MAARIGAVGDGAPAAEKSLERAVRHSPEATAGSTRAVDVKDEHRRPGTAQTVRLTRPAPAPVLVAPVAS